ncbi:DUF998 domain-containing protein [Candidatus Bathyarchaeota archaeon]|nr:DUF998 domain-containing protein [Candidatus Bathyarchaeota archaeon]
MANSRERLAGILFFVAVTQFIISLTMAEALYRGYSVSNNYVSDLGVGPSAIVFNSSVFILGLLIALGAFFLGNNSRFKTIRILLFLMSVGAMGVGIVTKNFTLGHGAVSSMAFFFGGLSAFTSSRLLKKPLSLAGIILGAITIGALALFSIGMVASGSISSTVAYDSIFYLGLGPGGMERMIIYPSLMWLALFGGQLTMWREE